MKQPKLKTFVAPHQVELEGQFNRWSEEYEDGLEIMNSTLVYSSALQKYVFSVLYIAEQRSQTTTVPPGESVDVLR